VVSGQTTLQRAKEKHGSYVKELLLHPVNTSLGMTALAAGALLSIPYGLGIGALPLLAFAAGDALATLFLPSSKGFRAKVDEKWRRARRTEVRSYLEEQIRLRGEAELPRSVRDEAMRSWETYQRMRSRIASMEEVARRPNSRLGQKELEQLEDATVNYLALWLTKLLGHERQATVADKDLEARLHKVELQLEEVEGATDRRTLEKARDDLTKLLQRRQTLRSKLASVDAAMLSMADAFEEVFQQAVTRPNAPEAGAQLQQAVDRMRLEEGLDLAIEEELGALFTTGERGARAAARKVSATR
jgi:hypothetical protein